MTSPLAITYCVRYGGVRVSPEGGCPYKVTCCQRGGCPASYSTSKLPHSNAQHSTMWWNGEVWFPPPLRASRLMACLRSLTSLGSEIQFARFVVRGYTP
jgi:hypothetical protein